ncbi:hypothetical protein SVAN01_04014 [Stagonosporopsis vannaccii]|nr:hypothetical protein SVAN01_04014 [Stagonosporopsis vannaccii]
MNNHKDGLPNALGLKLQRLLSSSPPAARTLPASPPRSNGTSDPDILRPSMVTLDVAGSFFKVSADTLTAESGLLRRRLSARFNWTPQREWYLLPRRRS